MDEQEMDKNRKYPKPKSVYFHQNEYIEGPRVNFVKKTKQTYEFLHSKWDLWYENKVVNDKLQLIFFAKQTGAIFSRKHQLSLAIGDEVFETFDTDNPEETYAIPVDLPDDVQVEDLDKEEYVSCDVLVHPTHYISPSYHLSNNFWDENRPHNVVLNFYEYTKIYGNKVVLALWSDYFDKLFFSNVESTDTEVFDINKKGVSEGSLRDFLELCLNRKSELHNVKESFSIEQISTAYHLQMSVPIKLIKNAKIRPIFDYDIIEGLFLSEVLDIPELAAYSHVEFVINYEKDSEKKKFLTENEEKLRNISIGTVFRFLNKSFNRDKWGVSYDNVLPDKVCPETYWDTLETGVNSLQDVCLLIGDERFEVHKEYLAFWSPFFDRLFFGDFIEKDMVEMEIKEVDPQEFSTLLRLIYPPGDVRIDDSNVVFLLQLADRFEMMSVMIMCCSYLDKKVTEEVESDEELMDILELADRYFLVDVQISCFAKIRIMSPEDLEKFRADNDTRLGNLSANTRNNMNLGL